MELWDLRVTVESIEGRSACRLAVGDYFEVTHSSHLTVPAGRHFCIYALAAVLPLLPAKQRALADDDWLERESLVCCPDPDERLVMRIERLRRVTLDPTSSHDRPGGPRALVSFQSDKSPADYERLAAGAEHFGFDALSVFGDLYFQPPLPRSAGHGPGHLRPSPWGRPASTRTCCTRSRSPARWRRSIWPVTGGRSWAWPGRPGSAISGSHQRNGPEAVGEAARIVAALLRGDRTGVAGTRFVLPPGAAPDNAGRCAVRSLCSSVPGDLGWPAWRGPWPTRSRSVAQPTRRWCR